MYRIRQSNYNLLMKRKQQLNGIWRCCGRRILVTRTGGGRIEQLVAGPLNQPNVEREQNAQRRKNTTEFTSSRLWMANQQQNRMALSLLVEALREWRNERNERALE